MELQLEDARDAQANGLGHWIPAVVLASPHALEDEENTGKMRAACHASGGMEPAEDWSIP